MRLRALPFAAFATFAIAGLLTGCTRNQPVGGSVAGAITVAATEATCAVSTSTTMSGPTVFSITNTGQRATEFEVIAQDGLTVVGELENIGPGLTRALHVQSQPGTYTTLCRPGMAGSGVGKAAFTVTGKQVTLSGDAKQLAAEAAARYRAYVRNRADALLTATKTFAAAYIAGNDAEAKRLYPLARADYERIEPVAESFRDLDPQLDARENDVAAGEAWTGWHRIEQELWAPGTTRLTNTERRTAAESLVARTEDLKSRVDAASYAPTADSISNGAVGLLDEIAKSKVTGEEERYSHTDLYDFQANVEGADVAYRGVRDLAKTKNPALVRTLDTRFAALDAALATHGSLTKGFASYSTLSSSDVKALSDRVNALAEPLSQLTGALLG